MRNLHRKCLSELDPIVCVRTTNHPSSEGTFLIPTPQQNTTVDRGLEIIEGGVLKIRRQDGTNRYINPACWVSINETPPSTSSPQIDPPRDDFDHGGDIVNSAILMREKSPAVGD